MQYLGKISYAWYLWHWPMLVFAGVLWNLSRLDLVLVTLASWGPAALTHHTIEERFRHSRSLGRRPKRALALGATCTLAAVFLAIGLQESNPPVPTASPELARGAMAIGPRNPHLQRVDALRPNPAGAAADKGALWDDGCVLLHDETESPPCVYGAKNSPKTVVAFGDSHAEQWFPPLIKLANRRHWRLIGLVRAGCVVGDVQYKRACDAWRRNEMRRIVTEERPDMVVVSDSTGGRYQIVRNGQRLDRRRSEPFLIAGFARTLRKLKRNGARVVVIRDQPLAPFEPPDCVSQNLHQLSKCTFLGRRKRWHSYDFFGAKRVPGVKLIDPIDILCPRHRCPSVMGRVLVYRNTYHMSATFARTLTPWLGRRAAGTLSVPRHVRAAVVSSVAAMRAIQIDEFGGPEVLRYRDDVPDPVPAHGEVVVEVARGGINFADTHATRNDYLAEQQLPLIPGAEISGRTPDGQRVAAILSAGAYAERVAVPAAMLIPVPDAVDDDRAAALLLQGLTAMALVRRCARIEPGETLVVEAAAGGTGSLAVQLGKRAGARVIGLASSEEKRALVERLGADASVDSRAENLGEAIREANDGKRVDAVLHMSGGEAFDEEFDVLAPFGRMVVFGIASREQRDVSTAALLRGTKAVIGFWLVHLLMLQAEVGPMIGELFELVAGGELEVNVGEVYPLSEAARAHEDLIARRTSGKLLLDPSK